MRRSFRKSMKLKPKKTIDGYKTTKPCDGNLVLNHSKTSIEAK